jgi:hypothetical protein
MSTARNLADLLDSSGDVLLSGLDNVVTFASGTKMTFFQSAAPTGWTQNTDNDDKALRVVSGTGGSTGGTHALTSPPSNSHTHTNTLSAAAHTLSTAQLPSHTHGGGALSPNLGSGRASGNNGRRGPGSTYPAQALYGIAINGWRNYQWYGQLQNNTGNIQATLNYSAMSGPATSGTGSGSSHSHSMSGSVASGDAGTVFSPSYIDVIVAAKDA